MSIPRKTGFLKMSDETKIYYELYGDSGPIIVLTYGIACLMNHWHFQIDDFAKDHHVLTYDLRGHHKSEMGPNENITTDLLAQDAIELLKMLFPKNPQAHFWGHSLGAPISFRCASLFPDSVKSIVLINGFYKNPFSELLPTKVCTKLIDNLSTFAQTAPSLSKYLWAKSINNPIFHYVAGISGGFNLERTDYKDIEIYSKGLSTIPLLNFFKHFKALIDFDGSSYFEQITCPALIVHGTRDGLIPLEQNKILAECLFKSTFLEFKEGSHCTQLDLPIELNLKIRDFLKTL